MPTPIRCKSCGQKLAVPDRLLGKTVPCPKCSQRILLQAREESLPPEDVNPQQKLSAPVESSTYFKATQPPEAGEDAEEFRLRPAETNQEARRFHAEDVRLATELLHKDRIRQAAASRQEWQGMLDEAQGMFANYRRARLACSLLTVGLIAIVAVFKEIFRFNTRLFGEGNEVMALGVEFLLLGLIGIGVGWQLGYLKRD
ncbi:MAG: hypothetical protein SFX18_08350 [Pirellulales bacterium]|nr:hypothetical protein [Pirellulales bacterium]